MTAATSPRSSAFWTALMSFGGQIATWSRIEPGTPADIGTSYGGVTPAAAPSGPPGEGPRDLPLFGRPPEGPPRPTPGTVAPGADLVKPTRSADRFSPATSRAPRPF